MKFIEEYKKLDNLCKDLFNTPTGITTYIENLEKIKQYGFYNDYKTLKHYRYIRNQIVHENYATEENMCTKEDTKWIVNFYNRILHQNDPLALYQKELKLKRNHKRKPNVSNRNNNYYQNKKNKNSKFEYIGSFLFLIISIILCILLLGQLIK